MKDVLSRRMANRVEASVAFRLSGPAVVSHAPKRRDVKIVGLSAACRAR